MFLKRLGAPARTQYGGPQWRAGFWAGLSIGTTFGLLVLVLCVWVATR